MTIDQIIRPANEQLGPIPIRRVLPALDRQMIGPFIFMDQGGPLEIPNGRMDGVPEHPHAGLSTFTYLLEGSSLHRDTAGNEQIIRSGDIALMTAGSGITHEELPNPRDKNPLRRLYFVQMWLALPDEEEEMPPAFEHFSSANLPVVESDGTTIKLLMGRAWDVSAPTTCHVETLFADMSLKPGATVSIEANHDERALFLLEGDARVGDQPLTRHDLNIMKSGDTPTMSSENGCRAILLGGARFSSPRHIAGSFVASSQSKILRWMDDYRNDRFPRIKR